MSRISAYFTVVQNERAVSLNVDTAAVEAAAAGDFAGSRDRQVHSVAHSDHKT